MADYYEEEEEDHEDQISEFAEDDQHSYTRQDRSTATTHAHGNDWQRYHKRVEEKLALERLRDAIRMRDRTTLEERLEECRMHEKLAGHETVQNATIALDVLQANKDLQQACNNKDVDAIKRQMQNIRRSHVASYLTQEVKEAKYLLETLTKGHRRPIVLNMDKSTMSEIRRYQNPPAGLHSVMQAALLLLGEDEDTTDDWRVIQRLANPQGQSGLYRRLTTFDSRKVHPELAARSKEILKDIDTDKIRTKSAAASAFYVWAMGVCKEVEEMNGEGAKPANRDRQRELMGRQRVPPPKMDRVYYRSLVEESSAKTSSKRGNQQQKDWPAGRGYVNDYEPAENYS